MRRVPRARNVLVLIFFVALVPVLVSAPWGRARAQGDLSAEGKQVYDQIKAFALTGGSADVSGLTLKRDRVEMTFTGTFYFGAPTGGTVTGAVFVGQGTMRAEAPPSDFERENVRRLIGADLVESDFKTAVLRFSDDSFALISAARKDGGAVPAAAQRLATETDARFTQEVGANIPARLAVSLLNGDAPGVFFAQFDGGRRGRFTYILDHQGRIPVANFGLNGGEKGLIFQYQSSIFFPEVWMAFYALDDYAKSTVVYSDANDVVDVTNYRLNLDVRGVPRLVMDARIDLTVRKANVRAISFNVGESLSASQKMRLVNQLRVKRIRVGDKELSWTQEDWEGGFTAFLATPAQPNEAIALLADLEGPFFQVLPEFAECFYPYDNVTWLPRHGYLDRATFEMTFRHRKRDKIVAVGTRQSEDADPDDPQGMITRYQFNHPVPLAIVRGRTVRAQGEAGDIRGGRPGDSARVQLGAGARAPEDHDGRGQRRLDPRRARQRRALLRRDVRALPVRDVRRCIPPVRVRTGLSDAADDPAGNAREGKQRLLVLRARDVASMVGQHRGVALLPGSVAERGVRGILRPAVRRQARPGRQQDNDGTPARHAPAVARRADYPDRRRQGPFERHRAHRAGASPQYHQDAGRLPGADLQQGRPRPADAALPAEQSVHGQRQRRFSR